MIINNDDDNDNNNNAEIMQIINNCLDKLRDTLRYNIAVQGCH